MDWEALTDRKAIAARLGVLAMFTILAWFAWQDLVYARGLITAFKLGYAVGWDLPPACLGLTAFAAGKDPYILANLNAPPGEGSWMTFPYPVLGAAPAQLFCAAHGLLPNAHLGLYLVILAGSCAALAWVLWRNPVEVALAALVSISAFAAYRWLALTANISILEIPFAALSIVALHRRRYVLSGAALGLMGSLKVLPLVGVFAFLLLPIGWAQKVRAIVAAGLTFAAFHAVNAAVSGSHTWSFVQTMFGRVPGQTAPFGEGGGLENPNFVDFIFTMFGAVGIDKPTMIASALALCALAAGWAMTSLTQRIKDLDPYATVRLFGLAVLICMLFLFRLKPYAYGTLVPFAIAALAFPDRILRWTGYITLAAIPAIWVGKSFSTATYAYFQTVCLISFIAVVATCHIYAIARQQRWLEGGRR